MELVDYLKVIWRHKTLVAGITVITVAGAFIATLYLPASYVASSRLRIVKPISITDLSAVVPSTEAVDITVYQQVVDDPQFKIDTLNAAKLKLAHPISLRDFRLSITEIKQTVNLAFSAEATRPDAAKVLANEGTQLLIKKTLELEYAKNDYLKKQIPARIVLIDKKLVDLRKEFAAQTAQPPAPGDTNKAAQIGVISDQIAAAEATRKNYTDIVAQLEVNDLAKQGSLQLVYNAAEPNSSASPSMLMNLLIALVVGLVLGAGSVLLTEFSNKPQADEK